MEHGQKSRLTDAYVAGLIDGEGCISIAKGTRGHYSVRVEVGMTIKASALLEMLQAEYGGAIDSHRAATDRWEAALRWRILGSKAGPFLERMLPQLLLKEEQARLALKMEEIRASLPSGRWTLEATERCERLRLRIKELNRKGPTPRPEPGLGSPTALLVAGTWVTEQSDLFSDLGFQSFSGTLPRSGSMRSGRVYERPTSVPLIAGSAGSCSPSRPLLGASRGADGMAHPLRRNVGNPRGRLEDQVSLLSTPRARDGKRGGKDCLEPAVLLPTPRATDGTNGGPNQRGSKGDLMLPSAVALLPTPRASDTGTAGRRASEGWRPPLSQVLLPKSSGGSTAPPSPDGSEPLPGQLLIPENGLPMAGSA